MTAAVEHSLRSYYPGDAAKRDARTYFSTIDPNGDRLSASPMADLSTDRVMLGGALGPVAAVLYALGFTQLFWGLAPSEGAFAPLIASVGMCLMMVVGAVYHALFFYTGVLARACRDAKRVDDGAARLTHQLLQAHRRYLLYIYRWAAVPSLLGSASFAWCALTRPTLYPHAAVLLAPALSAPVKLWLRRHQTGGLVLCGGCAARACDTQTRPASEPVAPI